MRGWFLVLGFPQPLEWLARESVWTNTASLPVKFVFSWWIKVLKCEFRGHAIRFLPLIPLLPCQALLEEWLGELSCSKFNCFFLARESLSSHGRKASSKSTQYCSEFPFTPSGTRTGPFRVSPIIPAHTWIQHYLVVAWTYSGFLSINNQTFIPTIRPFQGITGLISEYNLAKVGLQIPTIPVLLFFR